MGKKDLWQSDYFEDKRRFADAFNGTLFKGRQVLKPEELEEADSALVHYLQNNKSVNRICDKIRKWNGKLFSILILENQSYIDYRMVLRAMQEEILGYEKLRKEAYRKAKSKKYKFSKDEYLSHMKKDQKFIPIITLILYLGTDRPWDGAKTLYDLLEIDEELKPFVTNYRLNFYDYHDYTDFSQFKTENRLLFELLSCSQDKKRMKQVLEDNASNYSLDKESVEGMLGMIGVNVDLDTIKDKETEEYIMCKAIDDMMKDARLEGIRDGQLEEQRKNLESLMKNLNLSLEQAFDALNISEADRMLYV